MARTPAHGLPSTDQAAIAEQVRASVATTPASLLFGILASFIVAAYADRSNAGDALTARLPVWCWFLSVAVTFGLAAVVCRRFNRGHLGPLEVIDTVLHGWRWTGIVLMCAAALGSAAWVFLPSREPHVEFVLIAFMIAMMAAHGGTQANYPPLSIRFLGPATAVFVAGLLRLGDRFHAVVATGFVVLAIAIYFYTSTHARLARNVIVLKRQADLARHDAEAARREAELANEAKTAFLAVVGHDLRQPMHALLQYHGQLRRKNQSAELTQTIDRFGTSLEAMQDLLNSILDVSLLMTGSVTPRVKRVGIGGVFERIDSQMRVLAEDKGLRFDIRYDDIFVDSDEVLLERILRNLILNAIRYTKGGSVGARATRRGGTLSVLVFDTGTGIARTEQEKIFEYFYQVGNEARNRRHGLGLGLAIVRQLSKLLSVQVRLRSTLGRGSVFRLTLAAVSQPTGGPETAPMQALPERDYARGATVLLIDDDTESLQATSETLMGFGCRVLCATSADDAVHALKGRELVPDLIVADYRLEVGTGLDAIAAIRSNQLSLFGDVIAIQALILTGETDRAVLQKVREAGLSLLHKPAPVDELYFALNAELRSLALREA